MLLIAAVVVLIASAQLVALVRLAAAVDDAARDVAAAEAEATRLREALDTLAAEMHVDCGLPQTEAL